MLQNENLGSQRQPLPTFREISSKKRRFDRSGLGDIEAQKIDGLKKQGKPITTHSVLDQIISEIDILKPACLIRLHQVIAEKLRSYNQPQELPVKPRVISTNAPVKDRSKETGWLREHGEEYAGQWVALDGDRLLASGSELKPVAEAAEQAGVRNALYVFVESRTAPPLIIW